MKSEFILSLCEEIMGGGLGAKEKSIIDRCCAIVYRDYVQGDYQGRAPTLRYFYSVLLKQPEPEAAEIALAIELFVQGSLNTFAKPTNVNTQSRLICYDSHELGKTLIPVGMLVILDSIFNRIKPYVSHDANMYLDINSQNRNGDYFESKCLSEWYFRNLCIFSNLQSVAKEHNRIVVLYGAGHIPILRDLINMSDSMNLVDINDYI